MNKEIIKAMNKKSKSKLWAWWGKNDYKVFRVILFPLWAIVYLKDKINIWLNSKQNWNETRAIEILNYYIPRRAEWDDKEKCFYFFDNGMGWNLVYAKHYLKRKDRRFWKVNCSWWGGEMRTFLINKFELDGFTKEVGYCGDSDTEITYYLNKEKD